MLIVTFINLSESVKHKSFQLTLQRISSVSSRLIRTSRPPTSLIASWQVSCAKLKSRMEHSAMTVAVWLPPWLETNQYHCKIQFCVLFCK